MVSSHNTISRADWTELILDKNNMSFPIQAARSDNETTTVRMNTILWKKAGLLREVRYDYHEQQIVVLVYDGVDTLPKEEYEFVFRNSQDFGQLIDMLVLKESQRECEYKLDVE